MLSAGGVFGAAELGRILVGYRSDAAAIIRQVDVPQGASVEATLAAYQADPDVLYAERDFRVQASAVPNDSYFGHNWGLHNTGQSGGTVDADIDAPEAWDIATGNTRTAVAVIDSGIDYAHPDLYRNIWINQGEIPPAVRSLLVDVDGDEQITFRDLNTSLNQGSGKITDLNGNGVIDGRDLLSAYRSDGLGGWADGVSNDGDSYVDDLIGWNFVNNTNDPFDDHGHGTHVAGTIGASGNNGVGVAGVASDALIVGLKFMDASGGGYLSAALGALKYAVAKGSTISNNSWGGGGYSQAFYDALNHAREQGHIFVAAAGNGGSDGVGDNNDTAPSYPASYSLDNVIAVAATDNTDKLASFSNYGATSVDIAAPGVNILSTQPGGYAYSSGTSMAAPHVAGVVALAQSQNRNSSYSQVISRVLNNADKLSGLTGKVATGARLNAYRAVAAGSGDTSGPRVTSAQANASGANPVSSVRLTLSEAIDASTFTAADITGFAGPSGAITPTGVVAVAGSGNTQFDVTFATQSAGGTYRFDVGPDVRDLAGNRMDQDQDGVLGESVEDRYGVQFAINSAHIYSSSPYARIYDRYATSVSIHVDRDITIADLNVKLDIAHTYNGDLSIQLIAPDGTNVPLVRFRGGSGNNFNGTTLDDEASSPIAWGRAPFSGTYRPETALASLDGKNARGVWALRVEDWYYGDTGTINSWSLTFEGAAAAVSQSLAIAGALESPMISSARGASVSPAVDLPRVNAGLSRTGEVVGWQSRGIGNGPVRLFTPQLRQPIAAVQDQTSADHRGRSSAEVVTMAQGERPQQRVSDRALAVDQLMALLSCGLT